MNRNSTMTAARPQTTAPRRDTLIIVMRPVRKSASGAQRVSGGNFFSVRRLPADQEYNGTAPAKQLVK